MLWRQKAVWCTYENSSIRKASGRHSWQAARLGRDMECDADNYQPMDKVGGYRSSMCMLGRPQQKRSLTVKETMLETRVDKAEGMNVSCFGIGLIRRPTFCRAVQRCLAEALCSIFVGILSSLQHAWQQTSFERGCSRCIYYSNGTSEPLQM